MRVLNSRVLALSLCVLATVGSCASRYRLDLYMAMDEIRQRVDVEATQYVMDAELDDALAETKVRPGPGNVVVVTIGTRWPEPGKAGLSILGHDEYLRLQLFLGLRGIPVPDTVSLRDSAFVYLLGRYDWAVEDKAFYPSHGHFTVDSVVSEKLYMSVEGIFQNRNQIELELSGRFKVRASVPN